ncbi:MAG: tRNA/rRNA methyltransferase [Parvibaculaceae bacterium]|jgi:tRNA/rRNA methyltransferase
MPQIDKRKSDAAQNLDIAPAVVLVGPQLGENIGTAARAMLNFGLTEMHIVAPRDGWPNPKAVSSSAGADSVIENARIHTTTEEAIEGKTLVLATTARPRDMTKTVITPHEAARQLREHIAQGGKPAILFGRERTGLKNDEVALADAVVSVPLNPGFSSLNLAQAVLLMGYEWYQAADQTPAVDLPLNGTLLAEKQEILGFFEHLEGQLDEAGFLRPLEKRPVMVRNLRNIFHRSTLTEQEIRTLRGMVTSLTKHAYWRAKAELEGRDFESDGPGKSKS